MRKIAKDNNVDLAPGSQAQAPPAASPRRTSSAHLENPQPPDSAAPRTWPALACRRRSSGTARKAPAPAPLPGELVPMTKMRSIIARRMVESKQTSPHVHTVFKVDMTRIVRLREKEKSKYEQRNGVKLTYMPFITRAAIVALRKHPIVNGVDRRRRHPLQQEHQHRHRGRAGLGPDRPGHQAGGGEELPRHRARHRRRRRPRARQEARDGRDLRRHVYAHQLRHLRRAVRHCPSSTSRRPPSSASAA